MEKDRINSLCLITIETEIIDDIDFEKNLINDCLKTIVDYVD